jgi:hypothetical protein
VEINPSKYSKLQVTQQYQHLIQNSSVLVVPFLVDDIIDGSRNAGLRSVQPADAAAIPRKFY